MVLEDKALGSIPNGIALSAFPRLPIYGGEQQICATNDAFCDLDGRALFTAACNVVYKIRLRTVGIIPDPHGGR